MSAPLIHPYLRVFESVRALIQRFHTGGDAEASLPQLRVLRKNLIWAYSWAVADTEAVRIIASFDRIVEMGAGTGYWAWLCGQGGAQVSAFDRAPLARPAWVELFEGGPEVLDAEPGRFDQHALLLCWPPFEDSFARECLERYAGETVIYVGEHRGRTGDARFHDLLEAEFERETVHAIPQWPGFGDVLAVWKRKAPPMA